MGRTYIELSVIATGKTEEALSDFLFSQGASGLITEDLPGEPSRTRIRASFGAGVPVESLVEKLRRYQASLAALGLPVEDGKVVVRQHPIEDWGQNWKQHFTPLAVGRRLLITPPWELGPFPAGRLVLCIEPAMAFGTGHHATTRMCLEMLEEVFANWSGKDEPSVLDVGTGTGILAIAAARLGARRVVALDSDLEATDAAKQNLVLNRLESLVEVRQGGMEVVEAGSQFDLVLANLDTRTLCPLFGAVRDRLGLEGRGIISGVPVEEEEKVRAAAHAAGLHVAARRAEDGWLCLTLTISPDYSRRLRLRSLPPARARVALWRVSTRCLGTLLKTSPG
jgi:ribosomal protein L11 methyltransferase